MVTTYISHCGAGNTGFTIETLVGTHQEIVDAISERRKSYGNVDIINIDVEGEETTAIITYTIE